MSASCWTPRYAAAGYDDQTEAMTGYLAQREHAEDAYAALDALAAEAGYDVGPEAAERDGGACWRWEVWGDICVLDAGHPGPHEFTRTKDIVLEFAPLGAPEVVE